MHEVLNRTAIVGFTGSQLGMTVPQKRRLAQIFRSCRTFEFHHGDCIGADAEAHEIAGGQPNCSWRWIHPPSNSSKRAFCPGGSSVEPKGYLDRNHDIVDACDVLVATPSGFEEERRSGTWATVRYAKKQLKPVYIIWPDGGVSFE